MDHWKVNTMSIVKRIGPQVYLQTVLKKHFEQAKKKNKAYSLRAFANKLGISHSVLSEILRGKRNVSAKMAIALCEKCSLPIEEQKHIKNLFVKESHVTLSQKDFSFISEWQYFAILSLMETQLFPSEFTLKDAEIIIRKHLKISSKKIKMSLERLVKMNLLSENYNGLLELTSDYYYTQEDVPSRLILQSQFNDLDTAKNFIKKTPVLKREITSVTFAGDKEQIANAKKMIRKFRSDLLRKMKGKKRDAVYKMHVLLYPLSSEESN